MTSATTTLRLIPLRTMARRLGVPLTWLRGEADAGRVPALRAGQTYICDPGAVEAALLERARRAVPTTPEGGPQDAT